MRLKKIFGFLLTIIVFSIFFAVSAGAETYGDFSYYTESSDNGEEYICISGYNGTATSLTIPSKIAGYNVTVISDLAFYGNTTLQSVTIPDTVEKISYGVFEGCSQLSQIKFSSNLKIIGSWAFSGCSKLTSISFSDGLESIGDYAFYNCSSLSSVSIPSSVEYVGSTVFGWTPFLTNQTTPVKYVGKWVIDNNYPDTPVVLRSDTVGIASNALAYIPNTTINLPSTLKYIGNYAFYGSEITSITIPSSVECVGLNAFCDTPIYNAITSETKYIGNWLVSSASASNVLTVRKGTVGIAAHAITDATSEYLVLPDTLKYINDYAVQSSSIIGIYIPDSVEKVSDYSLPYGAVLYTDNPLFKENLGYDYEYCSVKKMSGGAVKTSALTSTSITLKNYIKNTPPFAKLEIYLYDNTSSTYAYKGDITPAQTLYKLSGLSPDTSYKIGVRACYSVNGGEIYSEYIYFTVHTPNSTANINAVKDKINSGYVADVKKTFVNFDNKCKFNTDNIFRKWAYVPSAIQFFDHKGNINFAVNTYGEIGSPIKIVQLDSNNKKMGELNIARKYELLGNVICDDKGYYYIIWGNNAGEKIVFTETAIAVSKYTNAGNHIKTTTYTREEVNTAYPFDAGNCDVVISNGMLICNFAREMCNGSSAGHQSNGVIAVNISDMSKNNEYYTYNSHSFDQRVIVDKYGEIWFASHGDFYSRAFTTQNDSGSYDLFHFYLDESNVDNMRIVNVTNAQMGGIADSSAGVVFVGASVKGMTESTYNSQTKNLFITSADGSVTMSGASSRTGSVKGETVTDTNIKWLTNYTDYHVNNPQVVSTDNDEIVVLWEKLDANSNFVESYYMILASNGMTIYPVTSMGDVRLNANEMPIYKNGKVYWVESNGSSCYAVELNIRGLVEYNPAAETPGDFKMVVNSSSSIRLSWNAVPEADGYIIEHYNGTKWVRTKKIVGCYNNEVSVTGLKSGGSYTFRIKTYVMENGKAYYSDPSVSIKVCTRPSNVSGLEIGGSASNAIRLNWTKNDTAGGYIIEQYKSGKWVRIARIAGNSTLTYRVTGLSPSTQYKFRIKAYKIYGTTTSYSGYTTISAYTNPSVAANLRIGGKAGTALRLNWDKNTTADGYICEMYSNGKWVRIARIASNTTVTYRKSGLTKGTTYKFRVRTYRIVNGVAYYGAASYVNGTTSK